MTKEEEEAEKKRVSKLSDYQKEMELRDLDRQIAKLSMLRGINTGGTCFFRLLFVCIVDFSDGVSRAHHSLYSLLRNKTMATR